MAKKRKKRTKEKYKYAFPNFFAKAMSKVSMRAQMESSMMSQFLLLIGLTVMVLFMIFSHQTSGFYKFMVIFNLVAAWFLITSYLVTTYQQYTSYMDAMGYDPEAEKADIKKKGNIFKRIKGAVRNKKKKGRRKKELAQGLAKGLAPDLVDNALKNMKEVEGFEENINKVINN